MNPVYILPGLGLFALGFILLFGLLASVGALAKSKQFGALSELGSGRAGAGRRILFYVALGGLFFGGCGVFVGVGQSDRRREKACVASCKADGFSAGKIAGSTERKPGKPNVHLFVACVCTGGPGEVGTRETPADSLEF